MVINGQKLTPRQERLVLALLREEALTGRLGHQTPAKSILKKIGVDECLSL